MTTAVLRRGPRLRVRPRSRRGVGLMSAGGVWLFIVAIAAVFGPLLAPYPNAGTTVSTGKILLPPSWSHLFGTDDLGRDVLSRVILGARISPVIAVVVVVLSAVLGGLIGLAAGAVGGVIDEILMRITDVFLAVPSLLLALAFAAVLPKNETSTILAIGISWWPWYARLVRGEAASVNGRPYIESCRALGLPAWRIFLRHVFPNCTTPALVQASLDFGGVLLTAASLSFLGLGVQPPTPEWGLMIADGQTYFLTSWWLVTFPGTVLAITAIAFNLVGDGLQERLNPYGEG